MTERHEVVLTGCTPTPLASYLKGLGVLRILSNCDPAIKAAWVGENLHLTSSKSKEDLVRYLLDDYAPTPVLSPWNSGSGFFKQGRKGIAAMQSIEQSDTLRFAIYKMCIVSSRRELLAFPVWESLVLLPAGEKKKRTGEIEKAKKELLRRLRNLLPDRALDWFDACVLLSGEDEDFPPLLGSGGNDGNLDFANNFMQRLLDLIDVESGEATPMSADFLHLALFAEPAPGLAKQAIGQFAPGQVGGPNATTGYDTKGAINPWDFVLMIEGALPFAAAAVRRNEQSGVGVLSYPFTVRAVSAGSGNLGSNDAASSSSRGELWMPLWSNPASYTEIRVLLSEGRVALGTRPARDALDFVRAVHRLGGYRGVDRFQRYGLLMRSGRAYLATPLERVQVTTNPQSGWIDELERNNWLGKFRSFSRGENTASHFTELCHRLENMMFVMAQRKPRPGQIQSLLILLGEIQGALSRSVKAHDSVPPVPQGGGVARRGGRGGRVKAHDSVPPVPQLSERWVQEANDEGPEFRIARALAGLRGIKEQALPLRSQLFPIHHGNGNTWLMQACKSERHKKDPACRARLSISQQRGLVSTLIALLQSRLSLPARLDFTDKPLNSAASVDLADLMQFLTSNGMDARISTLLPGLSLCNIPKTDQSAGKGGIHTAFALCKLALTPNSTLHDLGVLQKDKRLPIASQLLPKLASGDPGQARKAIEIAWRRLRSSEIEPVMPSNQLPDLAGIDSRRLAATLLIPLNFGATGAMARAVLKFEQEVHAKAS